FRTVLDQGDRSGQGPAITCADPVDQCSDAFDHLGGVHGDSSMLTSTDRAGRELVALALVTAGSFRTLLGRDREEQGVALSSAPAQGRRSESATTAPQLVDQVQGDPSARGTDRVSHGDGATVDVDDVLGNTEGGGGLQTHSRDGRVALDRSQGATPLSRR